MQHKTQRATFFGPCRTRILFPASLAILLITYLMISCTWGGVRNLAQYLEGNKLIATVSANQADLNGLSKCKLNIRNLTHKKLSIASAQPSCKCLVIHGMAISPLSVGPFGSVQLEITYNHDPAQHDRIMFVTGDGLALVSPVTVYLEGKVSRTEK